jgi:hypothetical protein
LRDAKKVLELARSLNSSHPLLKLEEVKLLKRLESPSVAMKCLEEVTFQLSFNTTNQLFVHDVVL